MKRFLLLLPLLLFCTGLSRAQSANFLQVTSSNIQNASGTKLASGTISFQGTDQNNNPISFQAGGGGPVITNPVTASIVNGVITSPNPFLIANPANTSPANVRYRVQILQGSRVLASFIGVNPCNQGTICSSGYTFNFDNCISSGACTNNPLPVPYVPVGGGSITGQSAGAVSIGGSSTTITSNKPLVGTDANIPTAGSLSGSAGAAVCKDSNGGIDTSGCASGVSLTATSPIVVTPSPTTGTGVVSCPTCTTVFSVESYGAVEDDATDNCTAFSSAAAAVNASTATTVALLVPHQTSTGIAYLLGCNINFTHPVWIYGGGVIDVKNTLTSGGAFELGPTSLSNFPSDASQIPPYVVTGLTFIGGAGGGVDAVQCEKWISQCDFNYNYVRNYGTSTSWAFHGLGGNNEVHIIGNRWWQDDTTTGRNAFSLLDTSDEGSDTAQIIGNSVIGNGNPPNFTGNCAGIGIYIEGNWTNILSNSIYGFDQQVVISNAGGSGENIGNAVISNAFDTHGCAGPGGTKADIWLGDAGISGTIGSLVIDKNRFTDTSSYLTTITPTASVTTPNASVTDNLYSASPSAPSCTANTGAGSGAACTVYGTDYNFTLDITAGTSASATGTVTLNLTNLANVSSGFGAPFTTTCLVVNGAGFDASGIFGLNHTTATTQVFNWSNGSGGSLTSGNDYYINGTCHTR